MFASRKIASPSLFERVLQGNAASKRDGDTQFLMKQDTN